MVMYEQQMTQFVMDKQEEQLNRLRKDYVFDDPDRVRSFLKSHRSLSEIFIEAVPELKRCFGKDATLQIQVLWEEGTPRTIYGVVLWKDTLRSARAALQRFDESWWSNSDFLMMEAATINCGHCRSATRMTTANGLQCWGAG